MKRRILELCGFEKLSREERLRRANEILSNTELKQSICHQILGTTHKDVEKAMASVISERQLTPSQEEEMDLQQAAPEKFEHDFDPNFEFKLNNKLSDRKTELSYRPLTREECAELLAASKAPVVTPEPEMPKREYPTLSREFVESLMREHFKYKDKERERKEQEWDLTKMTESEVKTVPKTKRSKSTKT